MEGLSGCRFKNLLVLVILVLILLSSIGLMPFSIGKSITNSRTSNVGNQPITGFSEGNETIWIYNSTGEPKTIFEPGENITINISSLLVNYQPTGPGKQNRITLSDYQGTNIDVYQDASAFTQLSGGPPYLYTATITAPGAEDHYLLSVHIKEANNQPGRDEFLFSDVIQVGNGSIPIKNMSTYSVAACITPDWVFGNTETVYIKVYTPNTVNPTNSVITLSDYIGNSADIDVEDLQDYTINTQDNDSIFAYNLLNDLSLAPFPDHDLKGYYWYTLSVDLRSLTNVQMANDWAAQIQILPPPVISETSCSPSTIFAKGSNATTLWTEFTDENTVSINNFSVTFRVRDQNNVVTVLVDNQTNGLGGLTITQVANHSFNASYIWNPPDDAVLGDYDLYAMVFDDQAGADIDGFNDNLNELTLLRLGVAPNINISNTTCDPEKINKMTNEMVTFTANFTDTNDPPININDFVITFKIRDEENTETVIAGNKKHGNLGDVAGSGVVLMTNYAFGLYSASVNWNPDQAAKTGIYDLYFRVSNPYGTASDEFENNMDELEIYSTGQPPQLSLGDTTCVPKSIDISARKTTMIYCEFNDPDAPSAAAFNVTFKVRPPSDRMQDVITLVDNKADGGEGEFGGSVNVELSGSNYVASYTWDPPIWVDLGKYDLYFMVRDEWNNTAEDPYNLNRDELELITSVTLPSIAAGNTICVPSSVNRIGTGTSTIYCEFTDSTFKNITDFNITFKLRDPNGAEIILVNDKPNGSVGEFPKQSAKVEILYSGTVFTASYKWDPPMDAVVGKYDLYFGVKNPVNGYAKDKFDNNLDELELVTVGNPPEIARTYCKPNKIAITGIINTTLYANFTDLDKPKIENFTVTFKVRDQDNNIIVLVDNKQNGGTGTYGGAVHVQNTTDGYQASYIWDPADSVMPGKYDLFFSVRDELLNEIEDGFEHNQDELELIGEVIPPGKPNIITEPPDKDGNTYTFKITYSDPDNDPPNDDGIFLFIDQLSYKMIEYDPNDKDYSNGKIYFIEKEFDEGEYQYYFKVTNSKNETFETDKQTLTVEPKKKDGEADTGYLVAAVIGIFLIIIIFLILLMLLRRKKPEPKSEPDYRVSDRDHEGEEPEETTTPEPTEELLQAGTDEPTTPVAKEVPKTERVEGDESGVPMAKSVQSVESEPALEPTSEPVQEETPSIEMEDKEPEVATEEPVKAEDVPVTEEEPVATTEENIESDAEKQETETNNKPELAPGSENSN